MKYSDKLNGYWEEGYHYYFDIRDGSFELRDAGKRVVFKTEIEYDADALERGEKTELKIGETTLAKTYKGEPMWYITALWYEDGQIHMDTHYTITGDDHYVMKKVDHDPFYNYLIRDDEYLKSLQGEWIEWRKDGKIKSKLMIKDNRISYMFDDSELDSANFHAVSYRSSPDRVFLNNEDLTVSGILMFSSLDVKPDMISGYEIICDAQPPLSVFIRRDDLGKIQIPEAAMRPMRNTMEYVPEPPQTTSPGQSESKGKGLFSKEFFEKIFGKKDK